MQILQWILKGAHEQERESSTFNLPTKTEAISDKNVEVAGKDVIILKHHNKENRRTKGMEGTKLDRKILKLFAFITFICGKDIPKTCYCSSSLKIKIIGNLNRRRRHFVNSVKIKGEELSRGNKILPITDEGNDQCSTRKTKYQTKGNKKKKPISTVKELLHKWPTAAKTEKKIKFNDQKVLRFPRHLTIEAVPDNDQHSTESPKISFTLLDMESCSTSSLYSAISIAPLSDNGQVQIAQSPIYMPPEESAHMIRRNENWITTEDFVVLEL